MPVRTGSHVRREFKAGNRSRTYAAYMLSTRTERLRIPLSKQRLSLANIPENFRVDHVSPRAPRYFGKRLVAFTIKQHDNDAQAPRFTFRLAKKHDSKKPRTRPEVHGCLGLTDHSTFREVTTYLRYQLIRHCITPDETLPAAICGTLVLDLGCTVKEVTEENWEYVRREMGAAAAVPGAVVRLEFGFEVVTRKEEGEGEKGRNVLTKKRKGRQEGGRVRERVAKVVQAVKTKVAGRRAKAETARHDSAVSVADYKRAVDRQGRRLDFDWAY